MFVGFIAVVVILLVTVGLMSSDSTSFGFGALESTRSIHVENEISMLSKSIGELKKVSDSYVGISNQVLLDYALIESNSIYTIQAFDIGSFITEQATPVQYIPFAGDTLLKSKSMEGVYYKVVWNNTNLAGRTDLYELFVVVDTRVIPNDSSQARTLELQYLKLATVVEMISTSQNDGVAVFNMK